MDIHLPSGRVTTIPKEELSDLSKMKLLGYGSFGQVHSYKNDETGLHIAIKRIPLMSKQFSKLVEQVKKEISIHTKLSHENIVRYYGCYKSDDTICIALELMNMSLKHKLNLLEDSVGIRENEPLLPSVAIMRYLCALLSGLVFLHHKKIIHRDLRSPNILLSSKDVLKIADFGISKELDLLSTQAGFNTINVGNMFWCAPEMADDEPTADSVCDDRVDVWSLGVVILEMVHNVPPFMRSSPMRYMKQLSMSKGPDIPTFLSEQIKEVLRMCFTFDAAKRPRSKDIMETIQNVYDPVQYDIFCSHNWGHNATNHDKVKIINEELTKAGFRTWFDSDPGRMEGNVHSAMSRGIESSRMALVFVTKEYQDKVNGKGARGSNDNCYLEFHHIVRKLTIEKTLAVVMDSEMQDDSKWSEVLGITMAGRIFVDMSGDLEDKDYLSQNIMELRKKITSILNNRPHSNSLQVDSNPSYNVTGMTKEELDGNKKNTSEDGIILLNEQFESMRPALEDEREMLSKNESMVRQNCSHIDGYVEASSENAQAVGRNTNTENRDQNIQHHKYLGTPFLCDPRAEMKMPRHPGPPYHGEVRAASDMKIPKYPGPLFPGDAQAAADMKQPKYPGLPYRGEVRATADMKIPRYPGPLYLGEVRGGTNIINPRAEPREGYEFGMKMPGFPPPSFAGAAIPDVNLNPFSVAFGTLPKVFSDAKDSVASNIDEQKPWAQVNEAFNFGMKLPKFQGPS